MAQFARISEILNRFRLSPKKTTVAAAVIASALGAVTQAQAYEINKTDNTITMDKTVSDSARTLNKLGIVKIDTKQLLALNNLDEQSAKKLPRNYVLKFAAPVIAVAPAIAAQDAEVARRDAMTEEQEVAAHNSKVSADSYLLAQIQAKKDSALALNTLKTEKEIAAVEPQKARFGGDITQIANVDDLRKPVIDVAAATAIKAGAAAIDAGDQITTAAISANADSFVVPGFEVLKPISFEGDKLLNVQAEVKVAAADAQKLQCTAEDAAKLKALSEVCGTVATDATVPVPTEKPADTVKVDAPKAEEKKPQTHTIANNQGLCAVADALDVSAVALAKKYNVDGPDYIVHAGKTFDDAGLAKVANGKECDTPAAPQTVVKIEKPKVHASVASYGGKHKPKAGGKQFKQVKSAPTTCRLTAEMKDSQAYKVARAGVKSGVRPQALEIYMAQACKSENGKVKADSKAGYIATKKGSHIRAGALSNGAVERNGGELPRFIRRGSIKGLQCDAYLRRTFSGTATNYDAVSSSASCCNIYVEKFAQDPATGKWIPLTSGSRGCEQSEGRSRDTATPNEPNEPNQPNQPNEPNEPNEPNQPNQPNQPNEPETPENPGCQSGSCGTPPGGGDKPSAGCQSGSCGTPGITGPKDNDRPGQTTDGGNKAPDRGGNNNNAGAGAGSDKAPGNADNGADGIGAPSDGPSAPSSGNAGPSAPGGLGYLKNEFRPKEAVAVQIASAAQSQYKGQTLLQNFDPNLRIG